MDCYPKELRTFQLKEMGTELTKALEEIQAAFAVEKGYLFRATNHFLMEMVAGLAIQDSTRAYMPMIPSYVSSIPTGKEHGLYLAADLGGTNFRVCSINLHGDHTFDLKHSKHTVPVDLMKANTSDALFSFVALKIELFLEERHDNLDDSVNLKMGVTFSFPVEQTAIDRGKLIRWTKGYDLPDCVGRDVVDLFQSHIDELKLPVTVTALANDTVGTLLSRSYSNNIEKTNARTVIGTIFSTGTNGAYFELIQNIHKIHSSSIPKNTTGMVINTEWGSFDNSLEVLPKTHWDALVDQETPNKGYHMFEKRISAMFLGELLRVILFDLFERGLVFQDLYKARQNTLPHALTEPFLLDAKIMSYLEIDDSTDLKISELLLENELILPTTLEERKVIQILTRMISHRAAYLSAIPIAAIVTRVKDRYLDDDADFEVGHDGSLIEFYPGFKKKVLEAFELIEPLSGTNKKVHLKLAKDGSGVGAALCACMAGTI